MTRHAAQMMTNAAIALHQTDLTLAEVVIADCDQMTASLENTEQRCMVLLAPPAPVAEDAGGGRSRARGGPFEADGQPRAAHRHHSRLKHPNPMISSPQQSMQPSSVATTSASLTTQWPSQGRQATCPPIGDRSRMPLS